MHPLDGIRAKLDRGEKHLETLRDETREFFEKQVRPYDFVHEYNPQTGRYRIKVRVLEELPRLRWGLLAGEFAHHFRSALDHLIWQLVLAEQRDPRVLKTQFPIYSDRDDFVTQVEKRAPKGRGPLAGLAVTGPVWTLIEGAQPYHRGDPADHHLAILNFLDNEDKHKLINATAAVGETSPTSRAQLYRPLRLVPIVPPTLQVRMTSTGPTFLEDGATFFDVQVLPPFPSQVEMHMDGDLFIRVGLGDEAVRGPIAIGHLRHVVREVRTLIESFGPYL